MNTFSSSPVALLLMALATCVHAGSVEFGGAVKLGHVEIEALDEISGLAMGHLNPGVLWVHNDGKQGTITALSTNGRVLANFRLPATVSDTEDLAAGPGPRPGVPYLYLGDVGDNDAERGSIRVFRFPEPAVLSQPASATIQPIERFETFVLRYPDGRSDAEAVMVDPSTGDLFIATKEKRRTRIYTARQEQLIDGEAIDLTLVDVVAFGDVSGGDISSDGGKIVLRHEKAARLWLRREGEGIDAALRRSPAPVPVVGPPEEPNGEAIAFDTESSGYYTVSEGKGPAIYYFPRQPARQQDRLAD